MCNAALNTGHEICPHTTLKADDAASCIFMPNCSEFITAKPCELVLYLPYVYYSLQ